MDGISEELADLFFHHYESVGWVDAGGNPILKPRSRLAKWGAQARAKTKPGTESRGKFWEAKAKLELIRKELEKIYNARLETQNGYRIDPREKPRWDRLRKEAKELEKELGL